ncbi:DEAD-box protein [Klebsormidium nitens]|uniref:DEAD-box protein n=1 Tax=Klebsormidium nitens TaxID=105231 RepID=A0A1Y1I9A0_KLENI|nr:DEAD-box protein [Klebsormidium nitens]|eukprot:GAQ84668.1 DEAD-box protein [Klebsormidium nitens]
MDSKANVKKRAVIVIDDSDEEEAAVSSRPNKRPLRDGDVFSWTEKKPKLEKKEGSASLGAGNEDCELLTRRPGEAAIPMNHIDDDDADIVMTGARGDGAALRDLPHPRSLCGTHPFVKKKSAQNAACCKQCFCYVCDKPQSQCLQWGTGIREDDHCNAYDAWHWQQKRTAAKNKAGPQQNRPAQNMPQQNPPAQRASQQNPPAQSASQQNPPEQNTAHKAFMDSLKRNDPVRPSVAPRRPVPVVQPSSAGPSSAQGGPSARPWTADQPPLEDPHSDKEYIPLGTVSIPVAARAEYDLVNLPPTHAPFGLGLFHMDMLPVKGATYKKHKMVYFRFDTGEQDLPRNKRPKQMEFDCLIAEIRARMRTFKVGDQPAVRVAVSVRPSGNNPRRGTVNIKLFQLRRLFDESSRIAQAKALVHLCKDDPVLCEQIEELRQLESNPAVTRIRSFDALLEKVQSTSYPEEPQPDGLGVTLRPYQRQSLRFMLDNERRDGGFHGLMWRQIPGAGTAEEDVFYCPALQRLKLVTKGTLPPPTTGGFLCEEMGLGKTVEILALILANPHPNPPQLTPQVTIQQPTPPIPAGGVPSKATLVVCAVSLVGQWISEAKGKLSAPINMYKYHGQGRSSDPFFLARQDIVVTTYATLGSDFNQCTKRRWAFREPGDNKPLTEEEHGRLSPLHAVNWWRIVLDESHTVKDPKAVHSRACAELTAERRWCCTGTPINTSISDLYGQFTFLKLSPFNTLATFQKEIGMPFEHASHGHGSSGAGRAVLVDLLSKVMIRHTKSQKINGEELLVLPPKTQVDMPVHFSPEERVVYERATASAQERFSHFRKMGPMYIGRHMLQIMSLLLPLRRICSGGQIYLPQASADAPAEAGDTAPEAGPPGAAGLPDMPPDSECGICLDVMERPARTPCKHWFCHECLTGAIDSGPSQGQCPICRQKVTVDDVVEGVARGTTTAIVPYVEPEAGKDEAGPSGAAAPFVAESKLKALLADLEKTREEDPTAKALIFSQFMGTIDWLKLKLTEAGVKYRYISGDMALNKRAKAIEQFQQDPPTTVFLLSIRTGAVGITLTSASVVYLLEPVLNPALEDQAVGRAWRMGQQRPVTVKRMFIQDSVEEKILKVVKSRVEGGNANDAPDDVGRAAYRSKGKAQRPETIAGSIRTDKQNLRMSEFEILFS